VSDVLSAICARKRTHIAQCKRRISLAALEEQAKEVSKPRGFHTALLARAKLAPPQAALIAEIKKASPSHGLIRADFSPRDLALSYAKGGAACLSVLTDTPYFQGEDAFLNQAREACPLPVLRKDFILDPYQVAESRALGADCILIIMAALEDGLARELESAARAFDMDVLIEAHDEAELERALLNLSSPLIGINNRNLKTLQVDLATTSRLKRLLPPGKTAVCESGIAGHAGILAMQREGVHCFLVGESLMRQDDVTAATRRLLGASA
jgi:indole-3-glycerol phosphate synthase